MFYSDVIDMLCLYIQQSLFDLLQNSINELLLLLLLLLFTVVSFSILLDYSCLNYFVDVSEKRLFSYICYTA